MKFTVLTFLCINQKAKRVCKELDIVFPKQSADPMQQRSLVLTPLVTFKELMDNVEKMQVCVVLCCYGDITHLHSYLIVLLR